VGAEPPKRAGRPSQARAPHHPVNLGQPEDASVKPFCSKSGETAMKPILASLALIASIGLSYAAPIDRASLSQTSSVTTEYPALHVFHHSVGETSYFGYYFNGKPSNCSVIIWSKENNEASADETTHQKVRIDLNAKQAITFFADDLGSNLSLECSADAKSLSVRQTSISLTQ
jgi:hypothetical protein